MAEIINTNIGSESPFASSVNGVGNESGSQSLSGSIVNVTSIVVVCEKHGMPISARHFNIEKGKSNKISLGAEMLSSMPDRVIFDIKVSSSTPSNESGFGGMFSLGDPPVLFKIPDNSPLTLNEMYSMVGSSQSRGIVSVTIAPIWRRGYFPFEMSINLIDPTTPGRISSIPRDIIEVYTESRAGNFFDSLDTEVRESNGTKTLSIIENRREEIQEILRTESSDPANCGKPCIYHTASLERTTDEAGDVSLVDLRLRAETSIPPSYNGFIIEDGIFSEQVVSNFPYRGNIFRQASKLTMSLYNFSNSKYAYDQLVRRQLLSSGTNENRPHPLLEISDPFSCMEAFANTSYPLFEFRSDSTISATIDFNSYISRVPYLLYLNIARINASNRIVPAITFTSASPSDPVSLSIQLLKDTDSQVRRKNDVGLIFTTTVGSGNSLRSFTNFLRVRTRDESDPFGSHVTYGSGSSLPENGWPHRDITIGDIYDLMSKNISGNVDGDLSDNIVLEGAKAYRGGQSCNGLFPTFAECGLISPNPHAPVIKISEGLHLSACCGLPAHRLWLGNTDNSTAEAITEKISTSMNPVGGSPLVSLFCRGPEKSFNLDNYTLAMPLARGASRAFMRNSIKEYADHVRDGDFDYLRANRYYPIRSISDAVAFLRHGSQDSARRYGIPENLENYLHPSGLAAGRRLASERRPCIGTSNIGISVNFTIGNTFNPSAFHKEVGSYFMSALSQTDPYRMTSASMSLRVSKASRVRGSSTFVCYSPGKMFNTPRSGIIKNAENDLFISLTATTGGEWHVLYSTLTEDYFGGIKYRDPNISGYSALDPMIHGSDASLKSEGGMQGSSKRKVYVNPCVDFGGNIVKVSAEHVGYDLDEFCRSTERYSGNVQRFVNAENDGSIGIPVTGKINGELQIRSHAPFNSFETYINGNRDNSYSNTFGNFVESITRNFGWAIASTPTATLAREDEVPFDKIRLELLSRPTPPIEPEPYGIEPYFDPYMEPYMDPYDVDLSNSSTQYNIKSQIESAAKSSSSVISGFDPYAEPYLEPYAPTPEYRTAKILLRSFRNDATKCELGYIPVISIAKIVTDSRYFDFNLSDKKSRMVSNLIRSIEDRLGPFGIHARSSVAYPESYKSSNIIANPRVNILETSISMITDIEVVAIPVPPDETYDSNPYTEPYTEPYDSMSSELSFKSTSIKNYSDNDPYVVNYNYNYIKKPKPVLSVTTGSSTMKISVETIDSSYSGSFALDFDFNVSRRSTPSNSAASFGSSFEQRPRNDPAVRALITGDDFSSTTSTSMATGGLSVNAAANPDNVAGENGNTGIAGKGSDALRDQANSVIRRQQ
jgi:hypothetical protein